MAGPGDDLFLALAQAKALPDKWARAVNTGSDAAKDILGGYLQGKQIAYQLGQPEAMARLLNATPQGHEIVQTMGPEGAASALYEAKPQDVLNYAGKAAELEQRGKLGYAGINERNAASQRAFQAAQERTKAQQDIFGGRNLTQNIANHENEVLRLSNENAQLSRSLPGGIGGTIQSLIDRNADISQYLSDPKYHQIVSQMKQNQQDINFHKQVLQPMYRAQGLIPPGVLDNSDLGGINPPAGGDNSIPTEGSTSGVSIF